MSKLLSVIWRNAVVRGHWRTQHVVECLFKVGSATRRSFRHVRTAWSHVSEGFRWH